MPRITRPQVYRVVREMLPRERFGPDELLRWLEDTQESNERAKRSHAQAPSRPSYVPENPSLNRRCNTSVASMENVMGKTAPHAQGPLGLEHPNALFSRVEGRQPHFCWRADFR